MHVCDYCGEDFPNLTELYQHKHMHKQSLVLHSHGANDRGVIPYKKRNNKPKQRGEANRKVIQYVNKKKHLDSDSDDTHGIKRYQGETISYKRGRESDSDLEVIEAKRYRGASDSELDVIKYKQEDNKLAVVPYVKTRKRKPKRKFIKPKSDSDSDLDDTNFDKVRTKFKEACQDELLEQKQKFTKQLEIKEDEINRIKKECLEKISVLQGELNEKDEKCKNELNEYMRNYTTTMSEMEEHYETQINILKEKVKSLNEDDYSFKPLADAIFNCITIEEIFKIKKLIRNREFEELISNHLDTLQKLFLSLSYGVIPICQPQREVISDSQKKLIEKIETSTPSKAKTLIMQNRSDIVNIFEIIDQSLELATTSYDKFNKL